MRGFSAWLIGSIVTTTILVGSVPAAAQAGVEAGASRPLAQGARPRTLPQPVFIHPSMQAGDVLARGNRVDIDRDGIASSEECSFDFGIEIALVSGQRSVTVGNGPDCTAVIQEVVDRNAVIPDRVPQRPVEGAPVRPIGAERPTLFGPARALLAKVWDAVFPTAQAQSPYYNKEVYGQIYMFGGGGQWLDGLTASQGWLNWRYNFTDARLNWGYGWSCVGGPNATGASYCLSPLGIPPMFPIYTGWVTYNFFYGDVVPVGTVVSRLDYASYRHNPTGWWQHQLFNRRYGYRNGVGSCVTWLNGAYVLGWVSDCRVY